MKTSLSKSTNELITDVTLINKGTFHVIYGFRIFGSGLYCHSAKYGRNFGDSLHTKLN